MYKAGSPSASHSSAAASGAAAGNRVSRHVPLRTCIGCRKKDDQAVLLRLVRVSMEGGNAVRVDEDHRMPGRGAWLHPDTACLRLAVKRSGFPRAFRGSVEISDVERWFKALEDVPTGNGLKTVQPESGSEI
ncbi:MULTISPECIES: YlxR family protein [unclassified Arthrobacter]|uniref:YlxR family protein n=1 Tax=unclassified Arthrobacter TaxID=235627 RepID=UPI001D14469D|nr:MULTISPECIES: YlxR family protein [unclassified Arthrobacter]MCC3292721.1 YlxR family protein [Arthrobacter sp. zg-Y1110]MCC3303098.1 YlxR family protein [Arthrobacter sp. zg-Y895]MCQ1948008.1 YlxR family protein [Arthrobacter sp. zg-Y1116]MCQ1987947.1 YlxR family protein [Arthrobacter sp. zg-Y844]MCQ1996086.1 YlxR family protein [Arthrobacter sp. zg-Y1171]